MPNLDGMVCARYRGFNRVVVLREAFLSLFIPLRLAWELFNVNLTYFMLMTTNLLYWLRGSKTRFRMQLVLYKATVHERQE